MAQSDVTFTGFPRSSGLQYQTVQLPSSLLSLSFSSVFLVTLKPRSCSLLFFPVCLSASVPSFALSELYWQKYMSTKETRRQEKDS